MSYLETLGQARRVDPDKPTNPWPGKAAESPASVSHLEQRPAPVRATREVHWELNGDTQYVRLELSENTIADLIYGLVATLRSAPRTAALFTAQAAGTRTMSDAHAAHIRRDIARYMAERGEDYLRLDDDDADTLCADLGETLRAIDEPEACHSPMCDHYAMPGMEHCENHAEALS